MIAHSGLEANPTTQVQTPLAMTATELKAASPTYLDISPKRAKKWSPEERLLRRSSSFLPDIKSRTNGATKCSFAYLFFYVSCSAATGRPKTSTPLELEFSSSLVFTQSWSRIVGLIRP